MSYPSRQEREFARLEWQLASDPRSPAELLSVQRGERAMVALRDHRAQHPAGHDCGYCRELAAEIDAAPEYVREAER